MSPSSHHATPANLFGPATAAWFGEVFEAPTPAQTAAWRAIGSGRHSLVIAPTGSGKTLAAFLHSLDRLSREPSSGKVRVLYVSPLKALAVDVERNLRAPLRGIQLAAQRLGLPAPEISVAVRSGDTPTNERRRMLTHPPDVLITTPESLFLMLSSQFAQVLDGVETLILDEVHALAGTKRGAHLALSLERLDELNTRGGMQRVGLSATVSPPERVAAFLGGQRPVEVVQPASAKSWQIEVQVPLPDMTELASPVAGREVDEDAAPNASIWPHVEQRVLELVDAHRSTICFVNSRRVAERLTAHLNELHAQRLGAEPIEPGAPAQVMAQSGAGTGRDGSQLPVIAAAHHGSVSKARREQVENDLKAGRLPCVVATSSLELGIDMGAVDLVIQVGAPASVASALQRIGRAGHQVGATSKGVVLPTHRGDLVDAAVVVQRMVDGQIESVPRLTNPLDVLAQHLVSMCIDRDWPVEEAWQLVQRADGFGRLPRPVFDAVLDMLSGRYPSEDFAELRPRLVWDRIEQVLRGRPGGRRLVSTSGGTIPDRGLFGVFLVGEGTASGKHEAGRRVGELDEEMVYESRVGDVFTLGTSSWRIEEITPNQVLVSPAPATPGRLPFWRGDQMGRPLELGLAVAEFTEQLAASDDPAALVEPRGFDQWARDNLTALLADQRAATGSLPGAHTILVERFRDELGDWRVCVHSQLGLAVLQPWALAIEQKAQQHHGVEARATATNDGIILRLPDVETAPPGADLVAIDPDELEAIVTEQVYGSALFAARFRECAARALLLPRRNPGKRSPLWQQRMRSAQLLAVASRFPDFPIVLETMRECLEDVFDLPALKALLREVSARRIHVVEVETPEPSPYARSLLFGYVGEFIYDGDQPLAERKLAALSLDPALLAQLLGREANELLLDVEVMDELAEELACRSEFRRATSAEQLWDVVRTTGPLTRDECRAASEPTGDCDAWLDELVAGRRLVELRLVGGPMLATTDDLALLRDGLGIPVPPGLPATATPGPSASMATEDAIERLFTRWLGCHVVTTAQEFTTRFGLPGHSVAGLIERWLADGTLVRGEFWPERGAAQLARAQTLAVIKRRTIARLRSGVEPVEQARFARFLADWHELDEPGRGREGLLAAVEALAGYPVPASMLESLVLPARVADYHPGMLDELLARGEVCWSGRGGIGAKDGWVQLWPADTVLAPSPDELTLAALSPAAATLWGRLDGGGAWRLTDLVEHDQAASSQVWQDALWELVWAGLVSCDGFGPLRELASGGALKKPRPARPTRRSVLRQLRPSQPASLAGRWAAVRATHAPEQGLVAALALQLGRYGVLTRGSVLSEPLVANFPSAYRGLSAMEDAGHVRRGYFVERLGAAQFALPGAVDRLREADAPEGRARLLAACDPANPWGAALAWPPSKGHRPSRRAGALVVLLDGSPVLHLERGTRTLATFEGHGLDQLAIGLASVSNAVTSGQLGTITIERVDQTPVLLDKALSATFEAAGFSMVPHGWRVRATH